MLRIILFATYKPRLNYVESRIVDGTTVAFTSTLSMGRGRRGHAAYSDQYGEVGVSQDRDMPPMGKQTMGSGSGGGTAGRTTVKGSVSYTRQLPKFLQKHAHLLAKAPAEAEAVGAEPDDVPDNDDTHDAVCIYPCCSCMGDTHNARVHHPSNRPPLQGPWLRTHHCWSNIPNCKQPLTRRGP